MSVPTMLSALLGANAVCQGILLKSVYRLDKGYGLKIFLLIREGMIIFVGLKKYRWNDAGF